jgi:hypothetical protein
MLNYNSTKTQQVDDNVTINEESIETTPPEGFLDKNNNK